MAEKEKQSGGTSAPARRESGRPATAGRELGAGFGSGPFSFMRRFMEDVEQLFDEFGLGGLAPRIETTPRARSATWYPQIEAFEREGTFVVRADLPGLDRDDVKLEIRDDQLCLEGERSEERTGGEEGYYRSERSYGRFMRVIPLPDGADADKAKANFKHGVLEVTIPVPQRKPSARRIDIEGEGGRPGQQAGGGGSSGKVA